MRLWRRLTHKRRTGYQFSPACQHLDYFNFLGRGMVKLLGVHVEDGCGCIVPKSLRWRVTELLYRPQPRPWCIMCDVEPEECSTC